MNAEIMMRELLLSKREIQVFTGNTYEERPCSDAEVAQRVEWRKVEHRVGHLTRGSEEFPDPERLDDLLGEEVSTDEVRPEGGFCQSALSFRFCLQPTHIGEKHPGLRSLTTFMSGFEMAMAHC